MKETTIYLTGFMGSGKSTIGPILANTLGWDFYDLDRVIEENTGKKIREIFEEQGERYFRKLESETLLSLSKERRVIIALGGGTMSVPANIEILKKTGKVIYLKVSPETVYSRLKFKRDRPVLTGNGNIELSKEQLMAKLSDVFNKRREFYELADVSIDTDNIPVGITVDKIAKLITHGI